MDLNKLIIGIELLNKDSLPNWGKMNSSMMLKHCSAFIDVYLNKTKLNPFVYTLLLSRPLPFLNEAFFLTLR